MYKANQLTGISPTVSIIDPSIKVLLQKEFTFYVQKRGWFEMPCRSVCCGCLERKRLVQFSSTARQLDRQTHVCMCTEKADTGLGVSLHVGTHLSQNLQQKQLSCQDTPAFQITPLKPQSLEEAGISIAWKRSTGEDAHLSLPSNLHPSDRGGRPTEAAVACHS